MHKSLISILILVCTFCLGQKNEMEELIYAVCREVVPNDFEYFNVLDSSFIMEAKRYSFLLDKRFDKEFFESNPDFNLDEFIEKNKSQSILSWRDFNIPNSRIYSYDNIPKFVVQTQITIGVPYNTPKEIIDSLEKNKRYDEIILPVKKSWSEKRIAKESRKKWKEYSSGIEKENKTYFRFSTPVFSDDKRYAIIESKSGGRGCSYIFRRIENKWVFIYKFNCWIA